MGHVEHMFCKERGRVRQISGAARAFCQIGPCQILAGGRAPAVGPQILAPCKAPSHNMAAGHTSHYKTELWSEHTVQIRDLEIGFWAKCSHRFLKYLVKFRNWKVALDIYRAISKTRISTVRLKVMTGDRRAMPLETRAFMLLLAAVCDGRA